MDGVWEEIAGGCGGKTWGEEIWAAENWAWNGSSELSVKEGSDELIWVGVASGWKLEFWDVTFTGDRNWDNGGWDATVGAAGCGPP